MESSRRDLLNDMAEHGSILKTNQNTFHPRLGFTPKTGTSIPKTGLCFYCGQAFVALSDCGAKHKTYVDGPFSLLSKVEIFLKVP